MCFAVAPVVVALSVMWNSAFSSTHFDSLHAFTIAIRKLLHPLESPVDLQLLTRVRTDATATDAAAH